MTNEKCTILSYHMWGAWGLCVCCKTIHKLTTRKYIAENNNIKIHNLANETIRFMGVQKYLQIIIIIKARIRVIQKVGCSNI